MTAPRMSARQLRRLLENAGLNQCQAAQAIGISPRAMRRYLSLDPVVCREPPGPVVLALLAVTRGEQK